MFQVVSAQVLKRNCRLKSFTLVELLVVIAIIGILIAITLAAASGVMQMAARNRARTEIQAMSTGLESYKTDNAIYPAATGLLTNSAATPYDCLNSDGSSTVYQTASQTLYQALSGKINFQDTTLTGKVYASFKANQLGNVTTASPNAAYDATKATYLQDPWGYSYGYSTGSGSGAATPSYPYNGNGFFDLWSTGGLTKSSANNAITNTGAWISNWQQ